jgi:hypothetical protein
VHKECEKRVLSSMEDLFKEFNSDYYYFQGGYFTKIFKNAWKIQNYYSGCLKEIANKQKIIVIRILVHLGLLPRKKGVFHHNQYTIPSTIWAKVSDADFSKCGALTKKVFAIILNPYYQYAYAYHKVLGSYKQAKADQNPDHHLYALLAERYQSNIKVCEEKRSILFGVKVSVDTLNQHQSFETNLKSSTIHKVYNEMSLLLNENDDSPLVGEFACLSLA